LLSNGAAWPQTLLADLHQSKSTHWLRLSVFFRANEVVDARQTLSKKVNLGAKDSGDYQRYWVYPVGLLKTVWRYLNMVEVLEAIHYRSLTPSADSAKQL